MVSGCVAVLLAACLPARVAAQVPTDANVYKGWAVASVEITGLEKKLADELEKGLALSGRQRLLNTTAAMFMAAVLEEDLARARLFLARHGYPDANVQVHLEPLAKRRRLRVVFAIDPGQRVQIADLAVEGVDEAMRRELVAALQVKPGEDFSEERVRAGADKITAALRARGYAGARTRVQVDRSPPTQAHLVYRVEPGVVQYFGAVQVSGVAADLVPVAQRTADIKRGARFTPEALKHADENLRLLGLFRRVEVTTHPAGAETLNVRCQLEERLHRSLQTGVGFWSDDLLRVEAGWQDRNLFKAGRGMAVNANVSRYLQEASCSFWKPTLRSTRTRLTLELSFTRHDEESYESIGTETSGAITQNISFDTMLRYELATSWTDYLSGEPPEDEGLLTSLSFESTFDRTNDRIWPTSGALLDNRAEWGLPGFVSNSHYVLDEIQAALYRGLGAGIVFASRLRTGLADPVDGSTELVPNKRFYAGGSTSMRGFGRNDLGPKDEAGDPVGGEAKLEASVETRSPVFKLLYGAVFADAGQVWRSVTEMQLSNVEVALGGGLMIRTPIGPLRFDVGHRVTVYDTTEPRTVYHFSIGDPF